MANEMDNERMTDVKPTYDDLLARVALLEQQRDQETAAAAATEALCLSESQLRAIIERSPMSMAVVRMDGTIEYFNRRAVQTFGYLHEDIPVMDRWWELAYPDEAYRTEVRAGWMGSSKRRSPQAR
ncbi:MAG: PAS domain-containing protein [Myxococcales bacterium]